ncbi:MAG: alpha/beta hydrolase [Bdellovibrio sp.]
MKFVVILISILQFQVAFAGDQCRSVFTEEKVSFFSETAHYLKSYRKQAIVGRVFDYYDQSLQTRMYVANNATPNIDGTRPLVDPSSSAVVVFFHGSGTMRSSGKNFLHQMNALAAMNISSISFDLPFHQDGPNRPKFEDPKHVTAWLNEIIQQAKIDGVPVYLAGHSFGPSLAMQYMYDYPFGVDGALFISPVAFNADLQKWYNQETSHMIFGENQLIDTTVGGIWGDHMLEHFASHLNPGKGDPTQINPNLEIIALTGDREEYAEAPLGGRRHLPIGKNTYSIPDALRKMFSRIHTVVAKNIGHYIFTHEEDGKNVVMRELFNLLKIDSVREKQLIAETIKKMGFERTPEQILWTNYSSDPIFRSWIDDQSLSRTVRQVYQKGKSVVAENILKEFRYANEKQKKKIVAEVLAFAKARPRLMAIYKKDFDMLEKEGLRDCLLVEEYINRAGEINQDHK